MKNPIKPTVIYAAKLDWLLIESGKKVIDLADFLGNKSANSVTKMRKMGQGWKPEDIPRIAEFFGVPIGWLNDGRTDTTPPDWKGRRDSDDPNKVVVDQFIKVYGYEEAANRLLAGRPNAPTVIRSSNPAHDEPAPAPPTLANPRKKKGNNGHTAG